ncbi:MAG: hypothetical protein M3N18_12745 [Actinomycetota bacterium]|nr:hypothetical protein [Actinomycetota bacterium]
MLDRPVEPRSWPLPVRLFRRLACLRGSKSTLMDGLMPEYQFDETHRIWLPTSPDRALEAIKRATPGEMPLARLLFGIRSLPAISAGRQCSGTAKTGPVCGKMLALGFVLRRRSRTGRCYWE